MILSNYKIDLRYMCNLPFASLIFAVQPVGKDCERLKLVMTTSHRVLTNEIESVKYFNAEALNDVDAWVLFKNSAGSRGGSQSVSRHWKTKHFWMNGKYT